MDLELDVEGRLVRLVERLGGQCIKHGQDGWPDRIVVLPGGVLVWVETKREQGRLADLQQYRAVQLARLGQRVLCLWNKEEVEQFIAGLTGE